MFSSVLVYIPFWIFSFCIVIFIFLPNTYKVFWLLFRCVIILIILWIIFLLPRLLNYFSLTPCILYSFTNISRLNFLSSFFLSFIFLIFHSFRNFFCVLLFFRVSSLIFIFIFYILLRIWVHLLLFLWWRLLTTGEKACKFGQWWLFFAFRLFIYWFWCLTCFSHTLNKYVKLKYYFYFFPEFLGNLNIFLAGIRILCQIEFKWA